MATTNPQERLWAREAADYLQLSRSTLAKWRMRGEGPPYHRCGPRLVYYVLAEIDAWLLACDKSTQAHPARV
jgi:predicted DNA-binding transcriptional regulator AlpA